MTMPRQHVVLPLFIVIFVLIFKQCDAFSSWKAASKVSFVDLPLFTEIYLPDSAIVIEPKVGKYLIFQQAIQSTYYEYCGNWQDQMVENDIESCVSYFCTDKYKESIVRNETKISLHVALHNYCTYCVVDDEVVYDVQDRIDFRRLQKQGQCPHFFPINFRHCSGGSTPTSNDNVDSTIDAAATILSAKKVLSSSNHSKQVTGSYETDSNPLMSDYYGGFVMLYEPLFNKSSTPYICYCPRLDRYGYRCDAYTSFFIGFNFLGKSWLFGFFAFCSFLYVLFVFAIPIISTRISKWYRLFSTNSKRFSYFGLRHLFTLKVHIASLTMLSLLFLCVEHILNIMYAFAQYTDQLTNSIGYLRIVSYTLLSMGFAAMYMHWASVIEGSENCSTKQKGLNVQQQAALAFIYGSVMCAFIVLTILSALFQTAIFLWILIFGIGVIYFGAFPVVFLLYAVQKAIGFEKVKHTNQQAMQKLRYTRLVILSNTFFLVNFIVTCVLCISNVFGWDVLGEFIGLYRHFFMDFGICLVAVTVLIACFNNHHAQGKHITFYKMLCFKCLHKNATRRKNKEECIVAVDNSKSDKVYGTFVQ